MFFIGGEGGKGVGRHFGSTVVADSSLPAEANDRGLKTRNGNGKTPPGGREGVGY